MFQNATAFDQNLNAWDVTNIPSIPTDFATGATLFTVGEHPIWGTTGGILYPLTNTATDFTSTQWRTAYGTAAGYSFIANLGILMPNGSPLTEMYYIFEGSSINDPDISTWDVSNVTNMQNAFANTTTFNQDISSWDVSSVLFMTDMFGGSVFNNGGVALSGNFASTMTSVTHMNAMFRNGPFNQDISSWNVSSVTIMDQMFSGATAFNQDISSWDVSSVTTMRYMFNQATAFNQPIGSWDPAITDMTGMFANASAFDQNLNAWDVSLIPSIPFQFAVNATLFTTNEHPIWGTSGSILYPLSNTATDPTSTQWRTNYGTAAGYQFVANLGILMPNGSPLTSMFGMFNVGSSDAPQGFNDPDISLWDVSNVTNMFAAFNGQTSFNQNLNSWNTSSVTNMNFTFGGNTVYNQPMNNWDLSAASITSYMFSSCTNFNGNLNGTFGSTIGLVSAGRPTNSTYNMFQFATAFNQPIGSWNTDAFNFTSDMFRDATAFDQDISGWNTSIVTNMSRMFWNALSFNQNISSWNTSSVTLMDQMFENANANQFNQNISSWNVINVTSATDFSLNAAQKGTQANNWQSGEHPSNGTLGNFYNL
jgi:surface protein